MSDTAQGSAAHRAAGAGAGEDHLDLGADPASGRRVRRGAGAGRRAAVVEGGRLSAVQRHPQQQADEIRARQGRVAVPGTDQPRQRADPRPAGPADRLRARQPPRHPAGARRQHHRGRQQLSGAAAQPAERCRRQVRRLHLLHRPVDQPDRARAVGPDLFRRLPRHARSRHPDPADRRFRAAQRPRLLARREACSTSTTRGAATSAPSTCCPTARWRSRPTASSPICAATSPACPTA